MSSPRHDYWSLERWRFVLFIFLGVLGGLLSGYWVACFIASLIGYIGWLLYKLQQLHSWLESGAKYYQVPDSNGIWERINSHIQTMQKKSDKRKKRMGKLLKRFQGIITSLPYATVVLTGNNEIDWANQTSARLLKLNPKKDRGQRLENLFRVPEVSELLTKNRQKEIEIDSPYDDQIKLAIQLIPVEADLKLLIARDISERVNVLEMRKNFIANASHELRTPLTVISGYLEIMGSDESLPETLSMAVESASEQSARMLNIIEDLLTLSRLENSELDTDKVSKLDLASIIRSICNNEEQVDQDKHPITCELDDELTISGIRSEVISVCSNLIHNAIRYTPDGTEIIIRWGRGSEGNPVFSVTDHGEGIAPEHLPRLTERFYRVDKGRSRDAGGTGLGLAIVQHIVQRHGGRLEIQSELGKGSVFSVVFP